MSKSSGYHTSAVRYDYYAVISNPTEATILLLPAEQGWSLPHFQRAERQFWQEVGHVNRAIHEQLGIDVTTLRCLSIDYTPSTEQVRTCYAMESHSPAWNPPPGGRWVGRADLETLLLAIPQHRAVIASWFDWNARPNPLNRVPWYLPGWFATTSAWLVSQLNRFGSTPIAPIEQLRSWQRSAILRAATDRGAVYLKAVPPMFAHEPRLTQALAHESPEHCPRVLMVEASQGWLLMQDVGGTTLDRLPEVDLWEAALRSFARFQIAYASRIDSLLQLGCPDRRLDRLATQIDPLFADTAVMLPGQPAGLSAEEIEQLRALAPRLKDSCRALASSRIPYSLEHGDFWAGQIVVNNGHFIFIDWSDSSISHPFFSLLFFLIEIEDFFPKEANIRARLRNAYLEPWTDVAPMETLIRAFELSQPLAALHHALIYHQLVLPNMEIKWEMELMLPFYLKMLLRLCP